MTEVKPGDNAWDIASEIFYDGYKWRDLVEQNPFLKQPGRVYYSPEKNWYYCMMKPGENLVTYEQFTPTVESVLQEKDTVGVTKDVASVPPVPLEYGNADTIALWVIASLIGLIILLYLISRFRREKREREANPVTSGAPQVVGGVEEANATQRIMNIAEARGMTPLRVTNIQRGRLFGRGNVSYADVPSGLTKRFTGEVGYRGIILRTDGTQETIYFLQGCGNDAQERFFTNIRFVADEIQPEAFRSHNEEHRVPIEVSAVEQKASTSEPAPKPFNWQEEYLKIVKKAVDSDKKIYFEVTIGSNKVRFDSTGGSKASSAK
ncbi:hypothetical protein IT400_01215 [Candidatus Nomurabacteria bacterium]|nr:hypothetical protein [Candidatus Nomurabacteria bacterium]